MAGSMAGALKPEPMGGQGEGLTYVYESVPLFILKLSTNSKRVK